MIITSILILIAVKSVPSISFNLNNIYFARISAIILTYSSILTLNILYIQSIGSGYGLYSGLFQVTQVTVTLELFLLLTGSFILVSWPDISHKNTTSSLLAAKAAIRRQTAPRVIFLAKAISDNYHIEKKSAASSSSRSRYYTSSSSCFALKAASTLINKDKANYWLESSDYSLIILFTTLGSCLLISSFDLLSLYISIELQSFGLYVLSTLYRDSEGSTKAGLKYFLIGGLASSIILFGSGIIYGYTGLTNFDSIYSILSTTNSINLASIQFEYLTDNPAQLALQGLCLGIILIFIGFFTAQPVSLG